MGIVLPDGDLNNPSLAWLRRWAEDQARLMAVVSLPEETFLSADATVKASLVFLRKFSAEDRAAWEAVWAQAHAELDPQFAEHRTQACAAAAEQVHTGGSVEAAAALTSLAAVGVTLSAPQWEPGEAPTYPRGIGASLLRKPAWTGTPSNAKRAAQLKRLYAAALGGNSSPAKIAAAAAFARLRKDIKREDEAHQAALWAQVRERADYPVFVAAPEAVGITSTGETGPHIANDLPAMLAAWKRFETWINAGAKQEDIPDFPVPLAA